ncbi:MAG: TIGR04133 family radical SAM/SPASM protein [Bacteroidales bacterium]|nr:TIGR04133 family radical SAM/SPASM protein [Bacteroidales bacterium]
MDERRSLSLRQRVALGIHSRICDNEAKIHELTNLFWECTLRCNMNCRHCGSDCKQAPAVPDMPAKDFLKAIDDITPHVNPHKTFITFTGGETLVRDDIEAVGLELYRRGFPWGLVTNGLLLDHRRLDNLLRSGMHSITVSFDGFAEDHNWIRRNERSFERADKAIRMLTHTPDLVWDIVTCVNPRNYGRLGEFKEYLISIGVRHWRLFSIFPMGRAASNPDLQLSDEQFRGLFRFIEEVRGEGRIHASYGCEGFLGPYEGKVRDYYFHCRAGINVASVLADGSISGCTSIRSNFHQGNIYADNLWDVWQNRFQKYRDRSWTHKGHCSGCGFFRYCKGSGMHLYDDKEELLFCHYRRLTGQQKEELSN